nr:relaxase domain-containing protein [Leucobacter weissii]
METVADEHTLDRAEGKAAYYMAGGTPPGVWVGTGLTDLGLPEGADVAEGHLVALFGEGVHPITGATLGRRFNTPTPLEERIRARIQAAAADPVNRDLSREEFQQLGDRIRQEETENPVPQSVAGFEFVFSPPKSVSAWWVLADPQHKHRIRAAHLIRSIRSTPIGDASARASHAPRVERGGS